MSITRCPNCGSKNIEKQIDETRRVFLSRAIRRNILHGIGTCFVLILLTLILQTYLAPILENGLIVNLLTFVNSILHLKPDSNKDKIGVFYVVFVLIPATVISLRTTKVIAIAKDLDSVTGTNPKPNWYVCHACRETNHGGGDFIDPDYK
jgi:hypothetical protein